MLGNPDRTARFARASLGLANVANRVRLPRWFLEKVLGVHRDKLLPDFARATFERWARRTGRIRPAPGGEAVLFQTCYVQHNEPAIGRDTVAVLETNQVDVRCAAGLRCCGMPATTFAIALSPGVCVNRLAKPGAIDAMRAHLLIHPNAYACLGRMRPSQ